MKYRKSICLGTISQLTFQLLTLIALFITHKQIIKLNDKVVHTAQQLTDLYGCKRKMRSTEGKLQTKQSYLTSEIPGKPTHYSLKCA